MRRGSVGFDYDIGGGWGGGPTGDDAARPSHHAMHRWAAFVVDGEEVE